MFIPFLIKFSTVNHRSPLHLYFFSFCVQIYRPTRFSTTVSFILISIAHALIFPFNTAKSPAFPT